MIAFLGALAAGAIGFGLALLIGWAALPISLGIGIMIGLIAGRAS